MLTGPVQAPAQASASMIRPSVSVFRLNGGLVILYGEGAHVHVQVQRPLYVETQVVPHMPAAPASLGMAHNKTSRRETGPKVNY